MPNPQSDSNDTNYSVTTRELKKNTKLLVNDLANKFRDNMSCRVSQFKH